MEIRIYGEDSPLSGGTKYLSSISGVTASFDDIYGTNLFGDGSNITNIPITPTMFETFVNVTGDTMTGNLQLNADLTVTGTTNLLGNVNITGTTELKGVIRNTGSRLVFGTSLDPETDRSQTLGSSTKSWGNVFTEFLTIEDSSGADQVILSVANQTIPGDIALEWELPPITGSVGTFLGVWDLNGTKSKSTWFTLSAGTNINLNQQIFSGGSVLTISSTAVSNDTYVTGFTNTNGLLTISQNGGQLPLTADTKETRLISFNSNDMALNTATRATLTPLVMPVTRFAGIGAVDDAGLSFVVPQDYFSSPEFYFTWRAATTSVNTAKIFLDIYTGDTNNTGSLTTIVNTVSMSGTPITANVFLYSSTVVPTVPIKGNDSMHVRIYRDPGDAGDTFTGDLDMINLIFRYKSIG